MNTLRKLWLSVLCAALMVTVMPAQAEVTWDQVKSKISAGKDYSVIYKYSGPNGVFDFDYRYAGDQIRTQITNSKTDASKKGTVIVYDKSWAADKVRAKTGGGLITRNVTHEDVKGRPFAQSLFGMILSQVGSLGKPTASAAGAETKFTFKAPGGSYNVWANANAEITKTERKDGKVTEVRTISGHKWNSSPKMGF